MYSNDPLMYRLYGITGIGVLVIILSTTWYFLKKIPYISRWLSIANLIHRIIMLILGFLILLSIIMRFVLK